MPTKGSDASNPSDYEGYGYDNNGNLTSKRLRSGDTITFNYDALNRATSTGVSRRQEPECLLGL